MTIDKREDKREYCEDIIKYLKTSERKIILEICTNNLNKLAVELSGLDLILIEANFKSSETAQVQDGYYKSINGKAYKIEELEVQISQNQPC